MWSNKRKIDRFWSELDAAVPALCLQRKNKKDVLEEAHNSRPMHNDGKLKRRLDGENMDYSCSYSMNCAGKQISMSRDKSPIYNGLNQSIKTVSAECEIKVDANSGRGLYAKSSIPFGVVVSREIAYATTPCSLFGRQVCDQCCAVVGDYFIECVDCDEVVYCSRRCVELANRLYHCFGECGRLRHIDDIFKEKRTSFLNAVRCILRSRPKQILKTYQSQQENQSTSIIGANLQSIFTLCAGESNHVKSAHSSSALIHLLPKFLNDDWWNHADWGDITRESQIEICAEAILKILDRLPPNQFGICALERRTTETEFLLNEQAKHGGVAAGLFIAQSLFNHSCVPNVEIFYDGHQGEARMLRSVEIGEQLTISYGPRLFDAAVVDRQKFLKSYNFICGCDACDGNGRFKLLEVSLHRSECCPKCGYKLLLGNCKKCNMRLDTSNDRIVTELINLLHQSSSIEGKLEILKELRKFLTTDRHELFDARTKIATALRESGTEDHVKMALKLLMENEENMKKYTELFPIDVERNASYILWTMLKILAFDYAPKMVDEFRNRAVDYYEFATKLYGHFANKMVAMRFGDESLLKTGEKIRNQK